MRTRALLAAFGALALGTFVLGVPGARAQAPAPGPQEPAPALAPVRRGPPRIELWSMGPGEVIFERFGHSVFCVFPGPPAPRDADGRCYNYGTTDFKDPTKLVVDFLRKKARFWVSIMSASETLEFYTWEDRDVWVQELPLTDEQAFALAARLEDDRRPENRFYVYDHFRDNCTTRLRDHLDVVTHGALGAGTDAPYGPTLRDMVRAGFSADLELAMLSELVPARTTDVRPTWWQAMFHPDVLRELVEVRFGVEPVQVAARAGRPLIVSPTRGRAAITWLGLGLAAVTGLLTTTRRRRWRRLGLVIAGLGLFAVSLPVWALVVGSRIPDLTANEAIIVVVPLDLALCFLGGRWLRGYLNARLGGLAVVVLLSLVGLLVQPLGPILVLVGLPLLAMRVGMWPPARWVSTALETRRS